MIKRWCENAIVTITPTDHYVAPGDRYLDHVERARRVTTARRDLVVILGVPPTEADAALGYLSVGELVGAVGATGEARHLDGFVEKPPLPIARGARVQRRAVEHDGDGRHRRRAVGPRAAHAPAHDRDPRLARRARRHARRIPDAIDYIYRVAEHRLLRRPALALAGQRGRREARGCRVERLGAARAIERVLAMGTHAEARARHDGARCLCVVRPSATARRRRRRPHHRTRSGRGGTTAAPWRAHRCDGGGGGGRSGLGLLLLLRGGFACRLGPAVGRDDQLVPGDRGPSSPPPVLFSRLRGAHLWRAPSPSTWSLDHVSQMARGLGILQAPPVGFLPTFLRLGGRAA